MRSLRSSSSVTEIDGVRSQEHRGKDSERKKGGVERKPLQMDEKLLLLMAIEKASETQQC